MSAPPPPTPPPPPPPPPPPSQVQVPGLPTPGRRAAHPLVGGAEPEVHGALMEELRRVAPGRGGRLHIVTPAGSLPAVPGGGHSPGGEEPQPGAGHRAWLSPAVARGRRQETSGRRRIPRALKSKKLIKYTGIHSLNVLLTKFQSTLQLRKDSLPRQLTSQLVHLSSANISQELKQVRTRTCLMK